MLEGVEIVWVWLRSEYWRLIPIPAELSPPSVVEILPVTGTVMLSVSLRRVLSLLPVHTSTVAFSISREILAWVAGGIVVGSLLVVAELLDSLARNLFRSPSRAATVASPWM